jgi:RNA polymerase sigma-70 factor (ECF subfamily)
LRQGIDRLESALLDDGRRGADRREDREGLVAQAVARAKEGDRDALRYLYIEYRSSIQGYVRSIVRDDHEAEDITQHVFAKLMTAIGRYEQRSVPFSAWILRVARNVALDHLRERRPIPCEEVRGASARSDEAAHERTRTLKEALASLPEEQREVLVLRHVVGLSPGEIAERLGKSEGSIHGLHHRGRRAIRAELTSLGSAPSLASSARAAAQ